MPLHALVESVQTLTTLVARARELRKRDDLPPGAVENLDRMTDETLETINSLIQTVVEAHTRGDLDAMVRREEDDIRDDL